VPIPFVRNLHLTAVLMKSAHFVISEFTQLVKEFSSQLLSHRIQI